MKRRNFLGMISGAATAPLVPIPALGKATYSNAAWNSAVATARKSAALSVNGMARTLQISPAAAETLMRDMVGKGILSPILGPTHGGLWASSKVMKPVNIAAAHKAQQVARQQAARERRQLTKQQMAASDWVSHLRNICDQTGMNLYPRCTA